MPITVCGLRVLPAPQKLKIAKHSCGSRFREKRIQRAVTRRRRTPAGFLEKRPTNPADSSRSFYRPQGSIGNSGPFERRPPDVVLFITGPYRNANADGNILSRILQAPPRVKRFSSADVSQPDGSRISAFVKMCSNYIRKSIQKSALILPTLTNMGRQYGCPRKHAPPRPKPDHRFAVQAPFPTSGPGGPLISPSPDFKVSSGNQRKDLRNVTLLFETTGRRRGLRMHFPPGPEGNPRWSRR
jgi:hypothetical protein